MNIQQYNKWWSSFPVAIFVIFIAACAYSKLPVLFFAGPDDNWMLLNNPYVTSANYDLTYFKAIFTRIFEIQYSPLNTFYYSLVYKINGFDSYYYHMANFIVHLLNSLMVYILSVKLLNIFSIRDDNNKIALITCVIWCIHPLNVEPVAWISGSKILISTLFIFLTINSYIKYIEDHKAVNFFFVILFFLISFFFKEQAILTPFVLLCISASKNVFSGKSVKLFKGELILFILMFLLVVPLLMITFKANNIESKYIPLEKYSLFKRFYLIFYCLCFYVTNSIVPNNLHYHYFYPIKPDEALPFLYYVYPFLFVLVCFFLLKRIFASKFKWFYLLCIALMAIELSIELQVIPMTRPAIVADRYMYFPLFPLILMALVYISNSGYRKRTVFKRLMVPFAVIYLIFFVTYSNQLVLNWYAQNLLLQ